MILQNIIKISGFSPGTPVGLGGGKKNSGARLFVERALKVDFHIYAEILLSKFLAGLKDKVIHQMCFFSAMRLLRSHVVQGGKKKKKQIATPQDGFW